MSKVSTTAIVQTLISKSPAVQGSSSDSSRVKSQLNSLLKQAAEYIRQYILTQAQVGHKNKFKKDGDLAEETSVTFDLSSGLTIELPDFADELDRGRKPGTYPPIGAIIAWIKEYNIQPKGRGKGRINTNSLAFMIQRAIYKNGIKARPFIENANEFAEVLAGDIAEQIILPSLVSTLDSTFKK